MTVLRTALALSFALVSTIVVNLAYLIEQGAAAALPPLSLRRPVASLRLLFSDRRWLGGFAMETVGFGLYVAALALAPLALVQSIGASGIGLLAFAAARVHGRRLRRREAIGAALSIGGLLCLGGSLSAGVGAGAHGATLPIVAWLAGSVALAGLVRLRAPRDGEHPASYGIAGGLLFSVGDISTKLATQGGIRIAFTASLVGGYLLGTAMLQLGYQRGGALTVAGIATLLTNALPIAAGTVLLGEHIPGGGLGVLRIAGFAIVVVGAVVLARPDRGRGH
jgi:drug/metabolite transporter (DMT)-like permease